MNSHNKIDLYTFINFTELNEIEINLPYYEIENFINKENLYSINKESIKNSGWKK